MGEPQHFEECDGNGSVTCWDCDGEGFYSVPTCDDPMADSEYECGECGGSGRIRCPGCRAEDAAPPATSEGADRFAKYETRGHTYVPLGAEKLSAKSQAEWDEADRERRERTVTVPSEGAGERHDVAPAVGEGHCGDTQCGCHRTAWDYCSCRCVRCGAGETEEKR